MKRNISMLFFSLLVFYTAIAQKVTLVTDSVYSKVLNEQRKIEILLPEEYNPGSDAKYDVVYILDGEIHFDNFAFIYQFARNEKLIPPLILVSVPNIYTSAGSTRDRDFVPDKLTELITSGGADNFITFFKNELIPYIEKKLPVTGDNTLYGHSLGGLFTLYVMLKESGLFTNYLCSDPALPWNNSYIITMAKETLKEKALPGKTLWIDGAEDTYRNVGIQKMDSVVKEFAPQGLHHKTSVYANETHMSIRLKGIYDGLKYLYFGYNAKKSTEFHANNGSILEGKPLPVFLNGSFPNVYYTTDGSEPDTSSEKAPQMIVINGPAELRVKWIGENEKYNITTKGNFVLSEVWPPVQNTKAIKAGGLRYSYYEGKWNTLPDFTKLKPVKTGIADSLFSLDKLPAKSNYACVFEGYLKIDSEGYYAFALCSSDGSKFFINGKEIIDNDGLHGSEWYKSYIVPLQKGYYPIRLEYFQSENPNRLDLIYISPDTHETVNLRFGMMYYR
jgi:predicted alpha/beta superfamily hydrolase